MQILGLNFLDSFLSRLGLQRSALSRNPETSRGLQRIGRGGRLSGRDLRIKLTEDDENEPPGDAIQLPDFSLVSQVTEDDKSQKKGTGFYGFISIEANITSPSVEATITDGESTVKAKLEKTSTVIKGEVGYIPPPAEAPAPSAETPARPAEEAPKAQNRCDLVCSVECNTKPVAPPAAPAEPAPGPNTPTDTNNPQPTDSPDAGTPGSVDAPDAGQPEGVKVAEPDSVVVTGGEAQETFLQIIGQYSQMTFEDEEAAAEWLGQALSDNGLDVQPTTEGYVVEERQPDPGHVEANLRGQGITDTAFIQQAVREANMAFNSLDGFRHLVRATIPPLEQQLASAGGWQGADNPLAPVVPQWSSSIPAGFTQQAPVAARAGGSPVVSRLLAMEHVTPTGVVIRMALETELTQIPGSNLTPGVELEPFASIFDERDRTEMYF